MGEKLTFWLIFCTLNTFSICDFDNPSAHRKYSSFPFTSNSLQQCFKTACVKQRTFISEMSSYILFGKIALRWDWGNVILRLKYCCDCMYLHPI